MGTTSRNSKYSIRKLPHDKRAIKLYGEHENYGRFYKCWNCGFIIDSNNVASGGNGDGISHTEFTQTVAGRTMTEDVKKVTPSLRGIVAMRLGGDGEPLPLVHHLKPEVGAGCSFCGTLNWR